MMASPAFGVLSIAVFAGLGMALLLRLIRWRMDEARKAAFRRLAESHGYAHEWTYPADFLDHLRFLSVMGRDARETARNVVSGERYGVRYRLFELTHSAPRSLLGRPYRGVVSVFEAKGMRLPYIRFAREDEPLAPPTEACDLLAPGRLPEGYCAHAADKESAAKVLEAGLAEILESAGVEFESNGYLVAVYRAGRLGRRHLEEFHDIGWRAFTLVRDRS